MKPLVVVDSREGRCSVPDGLEKYGCETQVMTLAYGDYQISDDIIFERKSYSDLIASIMDKRLFQQAKDLSETFKIPIIVIEGSSTGKYKPAITRQAILGSVFSICRQHDNIRFIPTKGPDDTAKLISTAAKQIMKPGKKISVQTRKKPKGTREQQQFLLESFPSIGPERAFRIMKQFEGKTMLECIMSIESWNVPETTKQAIKKIMGDL